MDAAAEARHQAVKAYLACRRAGGENKDPGAQLYAATARAIAEGKIDQARAELAQLLEHPDLPADGKLLIPILQPILDGSRDPALVDNPDLSYADAVEVRLLLETLPPRPRKRGLAPRSWPIMPPRSAPGRGACTLFQVATRGIGDG